MEAERRASEKWLECRQVRVLEEDGPLCLVGKTKAKSWSQSWATQKSLLTITMMMMMMMDDDDCHGTSIHSFMKLQIIIEWTMEN